MSSGADQQAAHCKKCDQTLNRPPGAPHGTCSLCGDPEWEKEFDLGPRVGRLTSYYVVGEATDSSRIVTLDLLGIRQAETRTSVQLSHRLKNTWRQVKNDFSAKSGTELIIAFDFPSSGPSAGLWVFYRAKRQADPRARKCRRHLWAIPAGVRDYDWFSAAHLVPCSCDPSCAVCAVAMEFSLARIRSGTGIDPTVLEKLRNTVRAEVDSESFLP